MHNRVLSVRSTYLYATGIIISSYNFGSTRRRQSTAVSRPGSNVLKIRTKKTKITQSKLHKAQDAAKQGTFLETLSYNFDYC